MLILLLGLCAALLGPAAATPTPTPTPMPRLRLDVDRHVKRLLAPGIPRFQVETTARTPQQAFESHMENFDPLCGPSAGGPPGVADMAPHRPAKMPLGGRNVLNDVADLKGSLAGDRYFLYRVTQPDGVSYLLREGRMPLEQLTQPGMTFEPIGAFPDRGAATRAWRRMQRGYKTPVARPPKPCGWD